jgi:prepilin peptidase CpaA
MREMLFFLPLIVLLAWAATIDLRTRRIPNWMTGAMIASGLIQSGMAHWPLSVGQAWAGLGLGFGLNFILFAINARGAGDVKLFAGVGAWVGPARVLEIFAASALVGLAIVLWQALRERRMQTLVRNSAVIVLNAASGDLSSPDGPISPEASRRLLPYSVPTMVATVLVLFAGRRWL